MNETMNHKNIINHCQRKAYISKKITVNVKIILNSKKFTSLKIKFTKEILSAAQ
jgi:hypothetical protein